MLALTPADGNALSSSFLRTSSDLGTRQRRGNAAANRGVREPIVPAVPVDQGYEDAAREARPLQPRTSTTPDQRNVADKDAITAWTYALFGLAEIITELGAVGMSGHDDRTGRDLHGCRRRSRRAALTMLSELFRADPD